MSNENNKRYIKIIKKDDDVHWYVNTFHIDDQSNLVHITLEKCGTMEIEQIRITLEKAEEIGLLNWNSLTSLLHSLQRK